MSKASEIMNPEVISVSLNATLNEVIKILAENKISGLPVVDENNRVVGMITEKDIIGFSKKLHIIPLIGFSGWAAPYSEDKGEITLNEEIGALLNTKANEVMSKKIILISEDASWHDIASLMRSNEINRIPVVDEEGKVKGIITRTDLLNYVTKRDSGLAP